MRDGGEILKRSRTFFKERGFRADFYHAGLEPHERARVQEAFFDNSENGLDIVVATNAFGMGIDKPDIRYIVHWTLHWHP